MYCTYQVRVEDCLFSSPLPALPALPSSASFLVLRTVQRNPKRANGAVTALVINCPRHAPSGFSGEVQGTSAVCFAALVPCRLADFLPCCPVFSRLCFEGHPSNQSKSDQIKSSQVRSSHACAPSSPQSPARAILRVRLRVGTCAACKFRISTADLYSVGSVQPRRDQEVTKK